MDRQDNNHRGPPLWALTVMAALLLASCTASRDVTYRCEGSAEQIVIEYSDAEGATARYIGSLPWEQTVSMRGNELEMHLEAANEGTSGTISCTVAVDGDEFTSADGEASVSIDATWQREGSETHQTSTTAGLPFPTPTPIPVMEVNNLHGVSICGFYLAEEADADWSADLLPGSDEMRPGETHEFPISAGTYDMKATTCEDSTVISLLVKTDLGPESFIDIEAGPNTSYLRLVNNTSTDLCVWEIGPSTDNRTRNLLETGAALAPGETRRTAAPLGPLVLYAQTCDGQEVLVTGAETTTAGGTWTLTDEIIASGGGDIGERPEQPTASLAIANSHLHPLCSIYLVTPFAPDWGYNYLETGRVEIGSDFTLTGIPLDVFDFRVVDCAGNVAGWYIQLDVEEAVATFGSELRLTIGGGGALTIVNNSSLPICGFAIRTSGAEDYTRNLLDPLIPLEAGSETAVFVDPGLYDLRAEACSGQVVELPGQNLGPGGYEWTISD